MGSLASKLGSIYNDWVYGNARILLLGLNAAGKTTILYRLKLNEVVETTPTIGFNVEEISPIKNVTFTMWDIGHKQQLTSLIRNYYSETDGIIFVIDASEEIGRLEEARDDIFRTMRAEEIEKGVPVVILANKQDKPNALRKKELADILELSELKNHPWHVQEMCALDGNGLVEGIQKFSSMVKRYQLHRLRKVKK